MRLKKRRFKQNNYTITKVEVPIKMWRRLVPALDGLGNIFVDVIRFAVAVDANKNVLVRVSERLQVLMVRCNANFDLKDAHVQKRKQVTGWQYATFSSVSSERWVRRPAISAGGGLNFMW
jgi:hypothetical protein